MSEPRADDGREIAALDGGFTNKNKSPLAWVLIAPSSTNVRARNLVGLPARPKRLRWAELNNLIADGRQVRARGQCIISAACAYWLAKQRCAANIFYLYG